MSSRKTQREAARQRRLEEERARAERARRQRRMRMLGGALVAAVAVVAAAVAISSASGGGGNHGLLTGSAQSNLVSSVDSQLAGIPQSGTRLGNPKAPVTLSYFGDLECPTCRAFTLTSFSQLVANDVKQGRVQVVYRSLQTATPDPTTFHTQQVAAYAAGQQNRFWQYMELFYNQQGTEGTNYVTEPYLQGIAKQIPGLNFQTWQNGRNSAPLSAQVQGDQAAAQTAGYTGTPTLTFTGPKGKAQPPEAIPTYSQLEQAVKQVA